MLFAVVFAASATPVFAISLKDMEQQATQYAEPGSPEWEAFRKAWSDYFLDLMPTENEPELLELLKTVPAENDAAGWHEFFQYGDLDVMYQELKRVSEKLDLRNPNLSVQEKNERLQEWYHDDFVYGPFGWGGGGRTENGYEYDCKTVALGWVALYRVAGIPATNIAMATSDVLGHTEAFYYMDGEWRRVKGSTSWTESFGLDYLLIETPVEIYNLFNANSVYIGKEAIEVGWPRSINDINEPWIDIIAETVMGQLLQQPMAYPERTLTRGEVAKLVCNYFGIVPMRSEAPFSDVPSSHKYARYIWAMSETGIMVGYGSGVFHPDDTLSMQEFAVIASRMVKFGKEERQGNLTKLEQNTGGAPKVFADADKIAAWAKPAVDEFSQFGVLQGDDRGRLSPTSVLDKTRFLVFMAKFEDRIGFFAYGDGGLSIHPDLYPLF
jgi:hypothetical protein